MSTKSIVGKQYAANATPSTALPLTQALEEPEVPTVSVGLAELRTVVSNVTILPYQ